ncbi:hypothetical protein [Methanolapillus africanus]|uniref:hypothetical protein n=1 Tax=Methanolapillus africanus TaxID=3028297 RepID=UPI0030B8E2F1
MAANHVLTKYQIRNSAHRLDKRRDISQDEIRTEQPDPYRQKDHGTDQMWIQTARTPEDEKYRKQYNRH